MRIVKFLHTADWHLGKKTEEYSRIDEQQDVLNQLEAIAKEEEVDGIIIAGDIYDRSIPSLDAIDLYRSILKRLNLNDGFEILAIPGNHDSKERLSEGKDWYQQTGFHLVTTLEEAFQPIQMGNVQLFLLPFVHPHTIRQYFNDDTITSIQIGMQRIVEKMESLFKEDCYHVLVTHYFVEGSLRCDSETSSEVGGLDNIHQGLFQSFDYVALGHLHSATALQSEKVRYSGSLLPYSLSEANQEKGVYIIDFADEMTITFRPFNLPKKMLRLTGMLDDLLVDSAYLEAENHYVGITLEDKGSLLNIAQRLRQRFPYLLSVERKYLPQTEMTDLTVADEELSMFELSKEYFHHIMDDDLSIQQQKWLQEVVEEVEMEERE